ncbi:MAG: hypothetical protein JWR69_1923 [Pedosphaera sp.]|nr:hypothetical protein [Pedosphaera sp.]
MRTKAKSLLAWLLILSLATGIAVLRIRTREQENLLADLRREKQELESLRLANEGFELVQVQTNELLRLRAENAALPGLRHEIRQLRAQEKQPQAASIMLRAAPEWRENQQLRRENERLRNQQVQAACIRNLEQIDLAKRQWAAENKLEGGSLMMLDDLANYFPGGVTPVCPAGGHYSINRIGSPPACSLNGHSIP